MSNSTVIKTKSGRVLISYQTTVAAIINGEAYKTAKNWSRTTSRHINQFLDGMTATEKPQEWFDSLITTS